MRIPTIAITLVLIGTFSQSVFGSTSSRQNRKAEQEGANGFSKKIGQHCIKRTGAPTFRIGTVKKPGLTDQLSGGSPDTGEPSSFVDTSILLGPKSVVTLFIKKSSKWMKLILSGKSNGGGDQQKSKRELLVKCSVI
ncbi:hypothetical protein INT45_003856 [Circinella minor]|uniref:Uncharacterized protein n=1 Tax=Circinella minor TaxID=1195481 RepID=A0A8H7SDH5_9FUNG|nr:hypothetical protein INT45_003856 [Circinella minor]